MVQFASFPHIKGPIVYDATLRTHHATSSNKDFHIFLPLSVLQSGQCHNKRLLVRIQDGDE